MGVDKMGIDESFITDDVAENILIEPLLMTWLIHQ